MSFETVTLTEHPSSWAKRGIKQQSIDCIIAIPPFSPEDLGVPLCLDDLPQRAWPFIRWARGWLKRACDFLKPDGHFYVYGHPGWLPHLIEPLQDLLEFKYWIAIQTEGELRPKKLKAEHVGLAFFCGKEKPFQCNKVRYPHPICNACDRTQKDYGGRSHLLNPSGCLISDVWKDRIVEPQSLPPEPIIKRILELSDKKNDSKALILQPTTKKCPRLPFPIQLELTYTKIRQVDSVLIDKVHQADILEFLRNIPSNSISLAFADPPYNLQKDYMDYSDDQIEEEYLTWCECWLSEYSRILEDGGALFVLNLPKWSIRLSRFLSQHLHLRNWIVWDALSEPRGKVMPAHYAMLYFTKGPIPKVFNYSGLQPGAGDISPPDAPIYCLRASCKRKRKKEGDEKKTELSDIWTDLHRIRHKRDRDHHPCQLPDAFMERIIKLSTRRGDIVLDALSGAGTTALAARRLERRFICVDSDPYYVDISNRKLQELEEFGDVRRKKTSKGSPSKVSKRALQLELVRLAKELGRTPTKEDVKTSGKYSLELYDAAFPVWSRALGAVRVMMKEK